MYWIRIKYFKCKRIALQIFYEPVIAQNQINIITASSIFIHCKYFKTNKFALITFRRYFFNCFK